LQEQPVASPDSSLASKRLYIAHLAQRLDAMERGYAAVQPLAYRLYARRLQEAMAGYPEGRLAKALSASHPAVADALANRHFATHGSFVGGSAANRSAQRLLQRLRRSLA
jgi:hypothetical protein